ncbi:TPA: N-acetyltransferase [Candidatus Micrarchaeota archaeon]|nr:N-acetyltransferase [Candidatus Micrarchaeota archaeon]
MTTGVFIHSTADVSPKARIGKGTKVWHQAQVREDAEIGENCIIGKNAYIDFGIKIGNNCKVQNNCSLYHYVEVEDGVFIGPHCVITNDKYPRAINADGTLKSASDWTAGKTVIKQGAAIGSGTIIIGGITIGEWAIVGAGSVVTKDVPPFALCFGNPARVVGKVDKEGKKVD